MPAPKKPTTTEKAIIPIRQEGDLVFIGTGTNQIPVPLKLALAELDRQRKVAEVEATVEAQLKMTADQLLKFIQYDRMKMKPKPEIVEVIRQGIEIERIPAERWYLIAGRDARPRIAPDSHGRFLKAQIDPKILIGTEEIFEHMPTETEPYVTAKVILHYYAGDASFSGTQTKYISWASSETDKQNTCNKTMTQARGKAARAASPSSYPDIAEEVLDFEISATVSRVEVAEPPTQIRHLGDLMANLFQHKLTDPESGDSLFKRKDLIIKISGVGSIEEIGTPSKISFIDAWTKLVNYSQGIIEEAKPEKGS